MEKYVETKDGLLLWSESIGHSDDPTILLVMGAMNQGIFWPDEFCIALARAGFYAIRYDHRDTGKSTGVDFSKKPYDLNLLAEDAISVLKGHGVQRANIVGLSMGGYIAQILAVHHPDTVQHLVLISTSADHRPYMQATMGGTNSDFFLPSPDAAFMDYIVGSMNKPPESMQEIEENLLQGWQVTYGGTKVFPREKVVRALQLSAVRASAYTSPLNHAFAVAASPHRLDSVKKITAPTLVIHGKYDVCLPLAHGEYLAKNIKNVKIAVLAMGHSFQWSWNSEILSRTIAFIDQQ